LSVIFIKTGFTSHTVESTMEARPELNSLCCVYGECNEYKLRGVENFIVRGVYGWDRIRYIQCRICGEETISWVDALVFIL